MSTPTQLNAADAQHPAPAESMAAPALASTPESTVRAWTARSLAGLWPQLALLGGVLALRMFVQSRAKRELKRLKSVRR